MLKKLKLDLQEFSGSFGDIGTVLPLIMGMLLATNLDPASVFIVFGIMQISMGIIYGIPVPIQPLKAVAILVITTKIAASTIYGAGLAIGICMLILTITGTLTWIIKFIPHCVIRGIQFGLGLSLAAIALKTYVPSQGMIGYVLAIVSFLFMVFFSKNRLLPGGLLLIGLGILYALCFKLHPLTLLNSINFALPKLSQPTLNDVLSGFLILALPQLPLSISNSIVATQQATKDLFPAQSINIKKIGLTYSALNLIAPFVSGIPVCHGCGGVCGYWAFGARTGTAVIINGLMYALIGLFFSKAFADITQIFPQPILGVILLFEALTLMVLAQDVLDSRKFKITILVALIAFALPQGYLLGIIVGIMLDKFSQRPSARPITS